MKKFITICTVVCCILMLMLAGYRYIMLNLRPYTGENGTVYIEIFGRIDTYYADPVSELDMN